MAAINELKWQSLTKAVNEMKSPSQFLRRLLYSNHDPQLTETINVSIINKGREIAPFTRVNGEATMVAGYTSTNQSVVPPNIRIKRPLEASELLFNRTPGSVIFLPDAGTQISEIQKHIARDLKVLADLITNAEEWLSAKSIEGTITYSVTDGEVFQVTYPKPAANNITLTVFWDDATPANVKFNADVRTAKKVISDAVSLGLTHAICGSEAADALVNLIAGGNVKSLDRNEIRSGFATLNEQYTKDGAIFLGHIDGVDFWEYSRSMDLNGVSTPMIRPKYVEFLAVTPAAERVLYYGAIPDMDAFEGRNFVGERFAKSWNVPDPSAKMLLSHSRPLPVPRRPGAGVSMKVVSG